MFYEMFVKRETEETDLPVGNILYLVQTLLKIK